MAITGTRVLLNARQNSLEILDCLGLMLIGDQCRAQWLQQHRVCWSRIFALKNLALQLNWGGFWMDLEIRLFLTQRLGLRNVPFSCSSGSLSVAYIHYKEFPGKVIQH